jgi:glycosyltransferase involved in cell wall biosynthesis
MRVALIHDYLTQHGGAERVLEAIHDLYPTAPVLTSVADLAALPKFYRSWEIHQSPLGAVPGAARIHRALVPLYPSLFRSFERELRDVGLVISDSSAWSHQAPAPPGAVHVCYCHSPARFLYGDPGYLAPAGIPRVLRPATSTVFAALRRLDRQAATRVDRYIANSRTVAARIESAYGRTSAVIYPPVDLDRFRDLGDAVYSADWCLVVSRLVPHKRIDLAVAAFTRMGLPLKVIGEGRAEASLRQLAGPTVEFLGRLDDAATARALGACRALILPAAEDFGITAVEAQAAGRPVIAFGAGGALETVIPGETGLFFDELTVDAVIGAVEAFWRVSWNPAMARANAQRFSVERFQHELQAEIKMALQRQRDAPSHVAGGLPER